MILTSNYGQAGAIERYGHRHGLPVPYSGHNSYWWWGPPPEGHDRVLLVGYPESRTSGWCDRYQVVATVVTPHGVTNEEDQGLIATCVLTQPWSATWAGLRHYN